MAQVKKPTPPPTQMIREGENPNKPKPNSGDKKLVKWAFALHHSYVRNA